MTERERTKKSSDFTSFLGKLGFYLQLSAAWDLLLQSLAAGPLSSAASPSPGRIPFDQAPKFSRTWLSPFSPAVLKLVGGCLRSHTATTRGNEGSFVDWHLIWSGSVQWSPQISPGPCRVCVCVSASLLLRGLRQLTKRSGFCGQTSKPSDEDWRCFFSTPWAAYACSWWDN